MSDLRWIGVVGCVFLVTQDLAITAGFLLTKVSKMRCAAVVVAAAVVLAEDALG
eukprot:COSAG02_NODE_30657_length_547_cov_1.035714_2_plen_54_part_00